MIEVNGASLYFKNDQSVNQVLKDVSFRVKPNSCCAIIGPSGCGKTSLLFLLAGLRKPDSGKIVITGTPETGTILQNYGLFPWKTVAQNISLGLVLKKEKKEIIEKRTAELLREMGLSGFGDHYPIQLSGGMQQRVALARALAVEPQILLMDEPLSSLDALTRERLQNLILGIQQSKKITIVLVTHSIEEAVFLGHKIIVLSKSPGQILQIVNNPEAGSREHRQQDIFFLRCKELRHVLKEEYDGQEA
jgi:NitT/TauT family transport system ATP-binding protein